MAKDDYHVIVFKILSYLYQVVKNGEKIDIKFLQHNGRLFQIHEKYWAFIMEELFDSGLIKNITIDKPLNNTIYIEGLENVQITTKGIEYLSENNFMKKAMSALKELKESVPFI